MKHSAQSQYSLEQHLLLTYIYLRFFYLSSFVILLFHTMKWYPYVENLIQVCIFIYYADTFS